LLSIDFQYYEISFHNKGGHMARLLAGETC